MQFIRKFLVFLASSSLIFLLMMTGITWTARYTVMNSEQVKSWLRDSKVYDNFIDQWAKGAYYKLWFMESASIEGKKCKWKISFASK